MASPRRAREIVSEVSPTLTSITLSHRQLCDLEMLLYGAFSPLTGFMDKATYNSVVDNMELPDGNLWPMPITLDLDSEIANDIKLGDKLALRDQYFNLIAVLDVSDKWVPDKVHEAENVFRTTDRAHPAVDYLFNKAGDVYVGGKVEGVQLPPHYDFTELRFTPAQARAEFDKMGWRRIVAFQTRNPMHRAHIELTRLAAKQIKGHPFINPIVGMTKPGDVEYSVRVRCYKAIVASGRYYEHGVFLGVLPLAMRMAGPREAMWHALIRKNYGATHFIVGRDHAGCKDASGNSFYGDYDAQELVASVKDKIGIEVVPFKALKYVPSLDRYLPGEDVPEGAATLSISGTKFRAMMNAGEDIPAWFSDPDVIKILTEVNPPLRNRGFTIFFTGLSGSGKTTISTALISKLTELDPAHKITVLDGDVVRTHLSKRLGFSIEDRNTNVARIGFVAGEVARHRGIAICVPIAPFEQSRAEARSLVTSAGGGFVQVYVSTSVEECAQRDVKGLYQRAADGTLPLTGVSHPYEMPEDTELMIDAARVPVADSVAYIVGWLAKAGYLVREGIAAEAADLLEANADEVLTEGIDDPAARLCDQRSGEVMLLGIGPYGSGLQTARLVMSAGSGSSKPSSIFALGQAVFDEAEASVDRATPARVLSDGDVVEEPRAAVELVSAEARRLDVSEGELHSSLSQFEEVDRDVNFKTGTPNSNPMPEDERVEVAWDIYDRVRKEALRDGTVSRFATSPRLAVYARHMLRFDACVRVVALEPATPTSPTNGATADETARYAEDYADAVEGLLNDFPTRVKQVTASKLATDAALRSELRKFGGNQH